MEIKGFTKVLPKISSHHTLSSETCKKIIKNNKELEGNLKRFWLEFGINDHSLVSLVYMIPNDQQ